MFSAKVLHILNTFIIFAKSVAYTQHFYCFCKSVAYMKQILLERQGYSERIENMFGKGMINEDVGICFLHISRHLHF